MGPPEILDDHCVVAALASGDEEVAAEKAPEPLDAVHRFTRSRWGRSQAGGPLNPKNIFYTVFAVLMFGANRNTMGRACGMGQRRKAELEASRRRARRRGSALRVGAVVLAMALVAAVVLLRGGHRAAAGIGIQIVSPSAGASVASPVRIQVSLQGARIGVPSTGLDHLHVSIDGGQPVALYQAPQLTVPLAPGEHTVAVQLADAAHDGILPVRAVDFRVGG